jgi:glucokinase
MDQSAITVLAGDVGGTKTLLALGSATEQGVTWSAVERYVSGDFASLDLILNAFKQAHLGEAKLACLGVPGPVFNNRCRVTNLPWEIDGDALGCRLINDLEAMGWGIPWVRDLICIQPGEPRPGNRAIIAPGTGLGEVGLFWDGAHHIPWASEGGQTDFAPRNELEISILRYCQERFGHVATERVVSGPGIELLTQYFGGDRQAAVDQFLASLGAEVGNLALKTMAVNGIYLAGGAVRSLGALLQTPRFLTHLHAKGRFTPLMQQVPVHLILDEQVALLGAARYLTFHNRMTGTSRS